MPFEGEVGFEDQTGKAARRERGRGCGPDRTRITRFRVKVAVEMTRSDRDAPISHHVSIEPSGWYEVEADATSPEARSSGETRSRRV